MMRFLRRGAIKKLILVLYIVLCLSVFYIFFRNFGLKIESSSQNKDKLINRYFPETNAKIISQDDWPDKVSSSHYSSGLGENGKAARLDNPDLTKKNEIWDLSGFDGLLSDNIALDRTLEDIRHDQCKTKKYNSILPTVSVVIPFFEEHWSTLLRTVVSVVNRSPPSLLKEIILVDDGSTLRDFLKDPLDKWLRENQPLAKVVRLPTRMGLIAARQEGVKAATGEVFVILDSHCEVMTGWLPPLLEPIVADPHTAVCPLIDIIRADDFSYYPQDEGGRGAFDWRFYYKRLKLRPEDKANYPEPFENPVMNGGLFAMNRQYFWELGGYDTGITIWGGEQYELSFKIWQCGGRLLDAPCSRVGHIFRHGGKKRPSAKNAGDFISKNYKRVAVVWMDEYAEALYKKKPNLRNFSPGDITSQLEVRERLKCKPFKWFLENVAPDLVEVYPPFEPPDFANGSVQSKLYPSHCIDSGNKQEGELFLYNGCHGIGPQYFSLSYQKIIERDDEQFCWFNSGRGRAPAIKHCTLNPPSSHIWRYDPDTFQIQSKSGRLCLDVLSNSLKLTMSTCNPKSESQKWIFSNYDKRYIKEKYSSL